MNYYTSHNNTRKRRERENNEKRGNENEEDLNIHLMVIKVTSFIHFYFGIVIIISRLFRP